MTTTHNNSNNDSNDDDNKVNEVPADKNSQVLVDTEELGQNEQDAPLAWFGAQPPPRTGPLRDDPTLPRAFLRTPSSVSTAENDEDDDDARREDHDGVGSDRESGGATATGQVDGVSSCDRRDSGEASGGGGIAAAGVGAAHVLTGPGRLEDGAWEEASSACPGMR